MSLYEAMKRRGYAFRQHLEEAGWTARKLTVVDLSEEQRDAFGRGGTAALKSVLERDGLWSFPAMDIEAPLSAMREIVLSDRDRLTARVAAPKGVPALWEMAERFVREVTRRFGISLDLVNDADLSHEVLADGHLILFGGGHDSALARNLALRYQTFFVDAAIPGPGGWVVTTHAALDTSGHSVLQAWADVDRVNGAMGCLLAAIEQDGDRVVARRTHTIQQGHDMRAGFPTWASFAEGLPMGLPKHVGGPEAGSEDPVVLAAQVAKGFDSGGPDVNYYNPGPVDAAISSAWYYLLSGEPRALVLFKELLFRLTDYYLKTPGGASYPADLDFRSGHAVLFWSRLEHDPVFSEEDRLILSNLLLAMTRSTYEYAMRMWPVEPNGRTRHNHETFPARSLMHAADYFRRYGVAYAEDWQAYSDAVFSGGIWTRAKQKENANHYEQTAYEHASCYSGYTGNGLALFGRGVLRKAAMRHYSATDNFLRAVDYSDTGASLVPAGSDMLAILATSTEPDAGLQWYANQIFVRERNYLGSPRNGIPGLRPTNPGEPPSDGAWEKVELAPQFIEDFAPGYPGGLAFDKLAFRTGWGDEDQYLLLEGVGGTQIGHAHNEVNGIVRYNHLGRHCLISNGYGRRTGVTNVRDSFSSRIRGPEDHNMLVLRREGEVVVELPVCAALLQARDSPGLAVSTSALLGYGGTDWIRTLVVAADRFLLVIDRIHVAEDGLEGGHVEWNALGEVTPTATGCRLDQRGVCLDVSSPSGWEVAFDQSDRSDDWARVLRGDAYPYADFPIKKVIYRMPGSGTRHCLATLLSATSAAEPVYRIEEPEPGQYRVTCATGNFPEEVVTEGDIAVRAKGSTLQLRISQIPKVPRDLAAWSAGE